MKNLYGKNIASRVHWDSCPACGKRSYRDRRTAKQIARDMCRSNGEKLSDIAAYRCRHPEGDAWHVGHRNDW